MKYSFRAFLFLCFCFFAFFLFTMFVVSCFIKWPLIVFTCVFPLYTLPHPLLLCQIVTCIYLCLALFSQTLFLPNPCLCLALALLSVFDLCFLVDFSCGLLNLPLDHGPRYLRLSEFLPARFCSDLLSVVVILKPSHIFLFTAPPAWPLYLSNNNDNK